MAYPDFQRWGILNPPPLPLPTNLGRDMNLYVSGIVVWRKETFIKEVVFQFGVETDSHLGKFKDLTSSGAFLRRIYTIINHANKYSLILCEHVEKVHVQSEVWYISSPTECERKSTF